MYQQETTKNNMNKATICPLPFTHIAIRPNGQVYPCCYFRHEHTPTSLNLEHPDILNHEFLQEIRKDLLDGKEIEGCKQCYQDEKLSNYSMRLLTLEEYTKRKLIFVPPKEPKLTSIDLALSNVCNNRCRMCNPELSTNWYPDAKKLGIPIPKGLIQHNDPLANLDLSQLEYIKLIGGEPLLEQEKFIRFLKRCDLSKLSVFLTTNMTVLPDDTLLKYLQQCQSVTIACSIDSYGNLNDFLRKGSKWETVDNSLRWYIKNFQKVYIHSVASIYNINYLDKLIDYVKNEFPSVHIKYVMIDGPDWMQISNLPDKVKEKVKDKIELSKNKEVQDIKNLIFDQLAINGSFDLFKEMDQKLNDIRFEHWKDCNQELYDWLKEFYE
jgi:radical SAM protein with 4Fe4S-binding SPASM domain